MRKSLTKITTLLLVLVAIAAADETTPTGAMENKYSLRAGFNTSTMSGYGTSAFGFQIGGAAEIPLSRIDIGKQDFYLNLEPGAQFVLKSAKFGWIFYSCPIDAYYVQVPVPVTFRKTFTPNVSVHVDLGPYFALGLFGTRKEWISDEESSTFDYLSRFDVGVYYGASIDLFKSLFLGVHFSEGFTEGNISSFYMDVGYNF